MNRPSLTESQIVEIQELVARVATQWGYSGKNIGACIFNIFQKNEIVVLNYNIGNYKSKILGLYLKIYVASVDKHHHYIALNSSVPYDEMIFNACHEYYHYLTGEVHEFSITRSDSSEDISEIKANRFAAELLLPKDMLELFVKSENNASLILDNANDSFLLRLIARIAITYQVPYEMVIRRLFEVGSINIQTLQLLQKIDPRNKKSKYFIIASNIGGNEFDYLNQVGENNHKVKGNNIVKDLLNNYDNNRISKDTLIADLAVFGFKLEDFAYDDDETIDIDDELAGLFDSESRST